MSVIKLEEIQRNQEQLRVELADVRRMNGVHSRDRILPAEVLKDRE